MVRSAFLGEGAGVCDPWPPPPKTNTQDSGFSLLEVLVATALMGLVLVVLLEVLSASLRAQEASQSQAQALLVADRVLWEYGDFRVLKPGTYQGEEGRFAYQVRLEPQFQVDNPASRVTCYLLQVTVFWGERGRTKSVGLQTVRVEAQKRS